MTQIIFIGFGAGVASALLYASLISGAALSIILFCLAPLPIMIAGLGWSHWAGLIAGAVACAGLALAVDPYSGVGFSISVALPAWWLGYLAMLARHDATQNSVEWYPVGRVVLWSAFVGALIMVAVIPQFGMDLQSFQSGLKSWFADLLRPEPQNTAIGELGSSDQSQLIDLLVLVFPPVAAVVYTLSLTFNLWLAGSIVRISGRLSRPWPDFSAMSFPKGASLLVVGSLAGSFLPDLFGIVSSILFASLLMAYALLGFAVLHAITQGMSIRGFLLAGTYAIVILFAWSVWPVLIMSLFGLVDTAFNLRFRVMARRDKLRIVQKE
jgi:hypothetical protein